MNRSEILFVSINYFENKFISYTENFYLNSLYYFLLKISLNEIISSKLYYSKKSVKSD